MIKVLNSLKSGLNLIVSSVINQWFYVIGLLWMGISFIYIGEPHFWTVLGFAIIFTGIQNVINEIKLNSN
tara:strand:- start:653 stop:862 length:210 start_codon:yes stop_codon:yes gene_type:complete